MAGGGTGTTRARGISETRTEALIPALVPLVFLVPVVVGVATTVGRLVQMRYPAYGWTMNLDSDAQAMALGVWPFQDPAHGYTGNAYTPLYPLLASLPNRLFLWSGWSVLITIAAGVGSAGLIAWLAKREPPAAGRGWRLLALAEAAGVGALGWSLVYGLREHNLFDAQNDQLTWFSTLAAIAFVPAAARGRRGAQVAIVLLASAAFWTKQPGIAGALAVAAGLGVAVLLGRMRARELVVMVVATLALNAALLAVLGALSGDWMLRWLFAIDLPVVHSVGFGVRTLVPHVALGVVLVAAMAALARAAAQRRSAAPSQHFASSDDALLVVSLGTLAVLGAAEGVYLLRFAAGADNDALAFVWALAGLAAIGYRRAGARRETRWVAAGICLVVALTALSGRSDWNLRRGDLVPVADYRPIPDPVAGYAKQHLVYHVGIPVSFVGGREGVYPTIVHIREDLTRGYTPWYLVHALVERRFSGVFGLFAPDPTDHAPAALNPGEHNFWWKLNAVIEANYKLVPGTPTIPAGSDFLAGDSAPMRVPRRTPPALWLARCFGPFKFASVDLRIHEGGGLWCRSGSTLTMRGTPASASQVESTDPVAGLGGSLSVATARAAGWWSAGVKGSWQLRADVQPARGLRLALSGPGTSSRLTITPSELHRSGGSLSVDFASSPGSPGITRETGPAASVRARVPADATGTLELWSSTRLETKFDLSGLRAD